MIDEEEFLAGYEVATKRRKHPCKHYERTENVCDAVPNIVQNLASDNSTLPGCERNESICPERRTQIK